MRFLSKPHHKVLLIGALMCLLMSCQDKFSYSYLIKHPDVLKQEVKNCEKMSEQAQENISLAQKNECESVMYAAANMISVLEEEQADPQAFGLKIMTAESALLDAKVELSKAKQNYETLKTKNVDSAMLQVAKDKTQETEQNEQKKQDEVNLLLSVAG